MNGAEYTGMSPSDTIKSELQVKKMTEEEAFSYLNMKYGTRFTWKLLLLSEATGYFVRELKKELGEDHELFRNNIYAVASNGVNDEVLYLVGDLHGGGGIYRIYHLTYSADNPPGYPRYMEFKGIEAVRDFFEAKILIKSLKP
ncbi:hypothetical protein [uncultured Ruminococcus sp.]|uniref:hypothetical protein n=1 Tax=uncultured Ruminococcus sp. TaxID=165186 RepID=UPI0025F845B8|nr:hypothetical protein [uncultured Ruminococcus sp.]